MGPALGILAHNYSHSYGGGGGGGGWGGGGDGSGMGGVGGGMSVMDHVYIYIDTLDKTNADLLLEHIEKTRAYHSGIGDIKRPRGLMRPRDAWELLNPGKSYKEFKLSHAPRNEDGSPVTKRLKSGKECEDETYKLDQSHLDAAKLHNAYLAVTNCVF